MKIYQFAYLRTLVKIKKLFDLRTDMNQDGTYEFVKHGVEFKSGNSWSLIFAIFIACIGLSVNSTAVIIGAMLISPLMGPIVGAGFSLAIHDYELLKLSIRNLSIAIFISLISSTLFFLVSPTTTTQSELLARTQPTFYDVLIAFIGGAAGIIANTRVNKGNAIPGVAIATALMPPLCTVGFGIAHLDVKYIFGAFYLFSINAVFILISTYVFTRALGFQTNELRNNYRDQMIHRWISWGAFVFIIPSIFMAWYLHRKSQFELDVAKFIQNEFNELTTIVVKNDANFSLSRSRILIHLFGQDIKSETITDLKQKMSNYKNLTHVDLEIKMNKFDQLNLDNLEKKFILRNELPSLIINEFKNIQIQNDKNEENLLNYLNSNIQNQVKLIIISQNDIQILWKTKPKKIQINQSELLAKKYLEQEQFKFHHLISVE